MVNAWMSCLDLAWLDLDEEDKFSTHLDRSKLEMSLMQIRQCSHFLFISPPSHSSPIQGSVTMLVVKDLSLRNPLRFSQVCSVLIRWDPSFYSDSFLKSDCRKFHSRIFYVLMWFDHSRKLLFWLLVNLSKLTWSTELISYIVQYMYLLL